MNFWEFKEDHSRGYYLPASNKAARDQGGQLVTGLFFLVANLFKLVGGILVGIGALLYIIFRWLWKIVKN
ncbi:hypothetical protein A8C56_12350 [Niabella ginsenosidivorans]|uniref:Uncharacterized protein n=1 Tax=Niabella ginsenosidivorans TaxID=1176587 RepID=A0A1A9I1Y5_9BACT|nr:hypothetical protein [Niabella ginsenosidivorans]ANH81667.1 hypothetical protein A8C56_12350 [Niabella ginsenosidivorans]